MNKKKIFSYEDMESAYNAGARNGSKAGMTLIRSGELNMKWFKEWYSKKFKD